MRAWEANQGFGVPTRVFNAVIESTTLRCRYEVRTEHDFTQDPRVIAVGSAESLLHLLG